MITRLLLMTLCSLSLSAAELIVHNAKITTLDKDRPTATALAVSDGLIVAVGSDREVLQLRTDQTQVIDAKGHRMLPGLNDSHTHATRGGRFYNTEVRWEGVPTLKEGLAMIAEQAKRTPKGQWVRVIGGWSPEQFAEKRMPTIAELNQAAPNTPVFVLFLYSQGFLNQAGLNALGIDRDTEAPWGSRYEKDAQGNPTGVLTADPNPMILYKTIAALPGLSDAQQVNSTRHYYRELVRLGLTSVIDAGGGGHHFPENYTATEYLAANEGLPLRLSYYLFPQTPGKEHESFKKWIANNTSGQNHDRWRTNGYSLEGGGEFLVWSAGDYENFMSPRPDLKDNFRAELTRVTEMLVRNKWPFRIHATYDESIRQLLDVFEDVNTRYPFKDIRWAIDHAETVSEASLKRIKALGGGIAIQNRMAFAGQYFKARYGADQTRYAPPVRKMLEMGIPVGAGTDGTRVSSFNPWPSLYWLVSGKTVGGTVLYEPDNRLSREEALRLFTQGSAWFSGEEHLKGTLKTGQYADFILTNQDYFEVDEQRIMDLYSVLTVVGGKVEWRTGVIGEASEALPMAEPAWSPVNYFQNYPRATEE